MKNITNYLGIIVPILVFIFSPFWNNFLNKDQSHMTFSYWLHWAIVYGGGALLVCAYGYCFWGGVQWRIQHKRIKVLTDIQTPKDIKELREEIKTIKKDIELIKYNLGPLKQPIIDRMATNNEKGDKSQDNKSRF
jgi:hypothetical protein